MPISDQLLSKLVCPTCKGKLDYEREEERLICQGCEVYYRITDDIPVLLADEAEKL